MTDHLKLIEAYVDGELTDAMEKELVAWLKADPANIKTFICEMHTHQAISNIFAGETAEEEIFGEEKIRRAKGRVIRFVALPLAAAAAAMLCVYGVWRSVEGRVSRAEKEVVGTVVETRGNIEHRTSNVQRRSGDKVAEGPISSFKFQVSSVQPGNLIRIGDTIQTGSDGYLKYSYADGSTVALGANSAFGIRLPAGGPAKAGHSALGYLEAGRLTAQVAKQGEGKAFTVATPDARAEVVGTKFGLTINTAPSSTSSTRLSVYEGLVRLTRTADDKVVLVAAGQFAETGGALAMQAQSTPPRQMRIIRETRLAENVPPVERMRFGGRHLWVFKYRALPEVAKVNAKDGSLLSMVELHPKEALGLDVRRAEKRFTFVSNRNGDLFLSREGGTFLVNSDTGELKPVTTISPNEVETQWAYGSNGTMYRCDPMDGRVMGKLQFESGKSDTGCFDGTWWIYRENQNKLYRLADDSGRVIAQLEIPRNQRILAVCFSDTPGQAWLLLNNRSLLLVEDQETSAP